MTLHETLWIQGAVLARSVRLDFPPRRTPSIDDVAPLMIDGINDALAGKRLWLYQAHNTAASPHRAYYRFGTDTRGMRDPVKLCRESIRSR